MAADEFTFSEEQVEKGHALSRVLLDVCAGQHNTHVILGLAMAFEAAVLATSNNPRLAVREYCNCIIDIVDDECTQIEGHLPDGPVAPDIDATYPEAGGPMYIVPKKKFDS